LLAAPACYGSSLGSNPDIYQKKQNGQPKPKIRAGAWILIFLQRLEKK
jgi:hypothetical protein